MLDGMTGFQRNLFIRQFNLAALQPELVKKYQGDPCRAMTYMSERYWKHKYHDEVLRFFLQFEVTKRTGVTYLEALDMDRAFYLHWKKIISETVRLEKEEEARRQAELEAQQKERQRELELRQREITQKQARERQRQQRQQQMAERRRQSQANSGNRFKFF